MTSSTEPTTPAPDTTDPPVGHLDAVHLDPVLLADVGARLGEGPAWDAEREQLTWVDILSGRVHVGDAGGRAVRTIDVGTHVGAALPVAGGGWLLATQAGFARLEEDGSCREILDVHTGRVDIRFNDAKCDPGGRALAGTMRYDETAGDGVLYRLDDGPSAVALLEGRGLCNGLGWSPDGATLYFVDSLARTVAAHPYDLATATVGPGRDVVRIDAALGMPDGLCVDDEGGIWVALHGGGAVHRYRPDGGLAAVVDLPVAHPTSVAFGGPDRDRLFVTSAGGRGRPGAGTQRGGGRGVGGLWAVEPGVTGPPATPWRPVHERGPTPSTGRPPHAPTPDTRPTGRHR